MHRTYIVHYLNLRTAPADKGAMPITATSNKEARQKFLVGNRNPYLKVTSVRKSKG